MTDPLAPARAALSDPNTPQNLREILEAELGRDDTLKPVYFYYYGTNGFYGRDDEKRADNRAYYHAEEVDRKLARLDQLWTEALGCAARSMERVRELEEGK